MPATPEKSLITEASIVAAVRQIVADSLVDSSTVDVVVDPTTGKITLTVLGSTGNTGITPETQDALNDKVDDSQVGAAGAPVLAAVTIVEAQRALGVYVRTEGASVTDLPEGAIIIRVPA